MQIIMKLMIGMDIHILPHGIEANICSIQNLEVMVSGNLIGVNKMELKIYMMEASLMLNQSFLLFQAMKFSGLLKIITGMKFHFTLAFNANTFRVKTVQIAGVLVM